MLPVLAVVWVVTAVGVVWNPAKFALLVAKFKLELKKSDCWLLAVEVVVVVAPVETGTGVENEVDPCDAWENDEKAVAAEFCWEATTFKFWLELAWEAVACACAAALAYWAALASAAALAWAAATALAYAAALASAAALA